MRIAVLGIFVAALGWAQSGRVEGRVESSVNHAPVASASLHLHALGYRGPQYTAVTAADGSFMIDQVRPGTYVLTGTAEGFLRANYGVRFLSNGQPLRVEAGELMHLTFGLTPAASISGRVVADTGGPVEFEVEALRWRWNGDLLRKVPARAARVRTSGDGQFQIVNLEPGRYYLAISNVEESPMRLTRGRPAPRIPVTYFPGKFEIGQATPIDLAPGDAATGLDFSVGPKSGVPGELVKIRGKMADNYSFRTLSYVEVQLIDSSGQKQTKISEDGSFEFSAPPGRYTILARDNSPSGHLVGRTDISAGEHGTENLRLDLRAGAEIRCRIERELPRRAVHDVAQAVPEDATLHASVLLRSAEGLPLSAMAASGRIVGDPYLRDIAPGRYWVDVSGLPAGFYVKRIRYGGQDVTDQPIRIAPDRGDGTRLEILLSNRTYELRGTVSGALPVAQVFLAAAHSAEPANRLMLGTLSNPDGTFHFKDVPPGDYIVLAFEDIAPGLGEDPGFRALFADRVAEVAVGAGEIGPVEVHPVEKSRSLAAERAGAW